MKVDRYLLETMVKGSDPDMKSSLHPLIKAHFIFVPQGERFVAKWVNLDEITPEGLLEIYQVIREARKCQTGKRFTNP